MSYTPFKMTTEKCCGSNVALLKLTEIVWKDTDSKTVVLVNFESVCNPVNKAYGTLLANTITVKQNIVVLGDEMHEENYTM